MQAFTFPTDVNDNEHVRLFILAFVDIVLILRWQLTYLILSVPESKMFPFFNFKKRIFRFSTIPDEF